MSDHRLFVTRISAVKAVLRLLANKPDTVILLSNTPPPTSKKSVWIISSWLNFKIPLFSILAVLAILATLVIMAILATLAALAPLATLTILAI